MLLIGFRSASGGMTIVSAANPLPVTGGGGGGGGDASAANQVTGNASLASIDGKLTNAATTTLQTALNTLVGAQNAAAWASGDGTLISLLKAIATAAIATAPTIVVQEAPSFLDIAESQSNVAVGNANDLLVALLVTPENLNPGAVTIGDGATATVVKFAGGTGSVSTLIPFPIDMHNIAAATNHRVSTGADVSVRAFYRPRT